MSKKLSKILAISVLILIIPVAIVVTAICLSSAISYELKIDMEGFENVGSISFKVNGVDYTEPVRISKDSDVTVSVSTVGYDFEGWYEGELESITAESEAVSTEKEYTFTVSEDTAITAKNNIIVYKVTYGTEEPVEVKYGANLSVNSDQDAENGIYFYGWTLEGDSEIYTVANFASREVVLTEKQDKIVYQVSYDGGEIEEVEFGTTLKAEGKNDRANGKVFAGWVVGEGSEIVTEAKFGKTFDVINLNSLLENMKFSKLVYAYDNGTEEAENVEFGSALKVLADNEATGDMFRGWKIAEDETVYTTANFIVEDETQPINLTAYFENIYELEESYKSVDVNWTYYNVNGLTVNQLFIGEDRLSELVSSNNIDVNIVDNALETDINEITVADLIEDVMTVTDAEGNSYEVESFTIITENGQESDVATTVTLKELVEKYNNLVEEDYVYGDEVVISIKISYALIVADPIPNEPNTQI